MKTANPNIVWSQLFVDSLANAGLKAVCIAPGSRSTPLTLAVAAHPDIQVYPHLDERSAAFFALGMALATDLPVGLICSSGTAVANFLPAIIEAKMSHVPLLIFSADRPHELRHSGANQTIDQSKLFGDQVLWSVDMPLPEKELEGVAIRNYRTLAARAFATANGIVKGPVHLNFPFRKPLEPATALRRTKSSQPIRFNTAPIIECGIIMPTTQQINELKELIETHERGLIICGPRCAEGDFPQAVAKLAKVSGYPIFADPLSGVRFGKHVADRLVVGGYETFLQGTPGWEPDLILRFGAVPTSKWLNAYLAKIEPAQRIHLRDNGVWADDSHLTTRLLQVDTAVVCQQLAQAVQPRRHGRWQQKIAATEAAYWRFTREQLDGHWFDATAVSETIALLPDHTNLVIGNSLPIRHADQFGQPGKRPLRLFGNRGASGIDGNISTALGVAASSGRPTVLIVGDITFYHDMNGLLAIKQLKLTNITIVLLNNDGGGIFNRLPIAQFDPPFTDLFSTPHGLDFRPVAQLYGLDYVLAADKQTFQTALAHSLQDSTPRIIEVRSEKQNNHALHQSITQTIISKLQT